MRMAVKTTARAGMLRPMAKVSVVNRTLSSPSCGFGWGRVGGFGLGVSWVGWGARQTGAEGEGWVGVGECVCGGVRALVP